MPHVRKPTYTRPIPANAEPCKVRGKPGVRWKGRRGKWVHGIISRDGSRCLVESSRFRIHYTDHEGRRASEKGYTDRAAAEHRMQALDTQAARIAAGLLDHRASRPRLSLTELLERWQRYIVHNGAEPETARRARQQAGNVIEGVGAVRVSDLTPAAVLEWIEERRRSNRHGKRPFGATAAASYIQSTKQFTRWCAVVEKCEPTDHLASVQRRKDPNDARHPRRTLTPSELSRLLRTAKQSEQVIYGLTGRERHALYLLACSTGFRAGELASLTRASFDLEAGEVTIQGKRAKNRRTDTIPIPPDVLSVVKPLLARAGAGPVWPNRHTRTSTWWHLGASMLRRDLKAAGIAYKVDGRAFDFHALRSQYATDLERAGVSLTRAQRLMRHSDPRLTSNHYTRPERAEMAADVSKLKRGRR